MTLFVNNKKSFLFLAPARLGDSLMITPALALLKRLHPACNIDVLSVSTLGASVFQGNPLCNRVYSENEIEINDQFVSGYELLIAAHRDHKILRLIDRLNKPVLLIEQADQGQHQAQQALNFIQRFFSESSEAAEPEKYSLFPGQNAQILAASLLPSGDTTYIGFHLGCHGINKQYSFIPWLSKGNHKKIWSIDKFVELARLLDSTEGKYHIVLTGGSNEKHLANEFQKHIPEAINLVGKTDLALLAAIMRRISVYISPDTGTMHVAAAMDIPLIALFGPTNFIRTGPYPAASYRQFIQSDNLSQLRPETVLQAIHELMCDRAGTLVI